jgi:hypothetical protein
MFEAQTVIFYVIADIPYSDAEAAIFEQQIDAIPSDAEFVVHLGDIRSARGGPKCEQAQYSNVATILRRSPSPVLILRGDNDWPDCPNPEEGYQFWANSFTSFEKKWQSKLTVVRESGRDENFTFVYKTILFVGLRMVGGGSDEDDSIWSTRLADQADWTMGLIQTYQTKLRSDFKDSSLVGRVILFGHSDPTDVHRPFFDPLVAFIQDELKNTIPILYMNGDTHEWDVQTAFFGESSFMRITVSGEGIEPPVKMMAISTGAAVASEDAFTFDRRF